ncbi:MAG: alanine racemase, partial [Rikenellaceae bacterium]
MRYRLSEIAAICGGKLIGQDRLVGDLLTDSRLSSGGEGTIFVAMQGAHHDSHSFVQEIAARGVKSFLVEREVVLEGISQVVVKSAIPALQLLAAENRSRFSGTVVAITGSNGKTTIKEWLSEALPNNIKIFRSPRSYNSQLGVALSLLMIEGDEQIAIIEAGISTTGEMERLERIIHPDIAIITSIGDAHQEGFASTEEKISEKLKLAKRAKKVIFHSSYNPIAKLIRKDAIDAAAMGGSSNAAIVKTTCREVGYPTQELPPPPPLAMRLEVREGIGGSIIINDSYSSDIHSLQIALDTLCNIAGQRGKTLIISDILQSGMEDEALYSRVAESISRAGIDRLIAVGAKITASSALFTCHVECYTTTEELLLKLNRESYANRAILIKGNRGSRFEKISHALSRKSHTTTLEVDLDAMVHNLNLFRAKLKPSTKLIAMVKASSYGAGDMEIAQTLHREGVSYLAVAFADEGCTLRDRGITMPIIVLNADDGSFSQMIDYNLEPEIYSLRSLRDFAEALRAHGEQSYPIHIKLDSGMHRLGFSEQELPELISELSLLRGTIKVASIFSHLSRADMPSEREYTTNQIARFDKMSTMLAEALTYPVVRHTANSAAIAHHPSAEFDLCRLGIGLYGFGQKGLKPISTLRSKIVQIKEHAAGAPIGYGGEDKTTKDSRIATIPIGYADGLNRHLGRGAWSVIVHGKSAPIIGRICMDSCMIDITEIAEAVEGDEVKIFSPIEG